MRIKYNEETGRNNGNQSFTPDLTFFTTFERFATVDETL